MGFIQARSDNAIPAPTTLDTSQIRIESKEPEIELPKKMIWIGLNMHNLITKQTTH